MHWQGFVYPSILKDNNLRKTESAGGRPQPLRMVTQPAKFKAVIHFWEDKQVFLIPWSLLSLKRSEQQVSHLWVPWETTAWRANVTYGKNRHLGFHFEAQSLVGHIYWWAAYFTGAALSCLLESSGRKALLLLSSLHPRKLAHSSSLSAAVTSFEGHPWPGLHPFPNRTNHTLSEQHCLLAVDKLLSLSEIQFLHQ